MERSRVAQHQHQFLEQFGRLDGELRDLEAALSRDAVATASAISPPLSDVAESPASTDPRALERSQQQILRLYYQLADLCGQYRDYKRATAYYHKVLEWLQSRESSSLSVVVPANTASSASPDPKPALRRARSRATPPETQHGASTRAIADSINPSNTDANANVNANVNTNTKSASNACERVPSSLTESERLLLKENVLNNLSAMYFGAGEHSQAMSCLLDAKKLARDHSGTGPAPTTDPEEEEDEGEGEEPAASLTDSNARAVTAPVTAAPAAATIVTTTAAAKQPNPTLTVNYALYLHAKGNIEDAIHAASLVVEAAIADTRGGGDGNESASHDGARAKITALSCTYVVGSVVMRAPLRFDIGSAL